MSEVSKYGFSHAGKRLKTALLHTKPGKRVAMNYFVIKIRVGKIQEF